MSSPDPEANISQDGRFATTHWSLVLAAGDSSAPSTRQALESLCHAYWPPLYFFLRRRGHTVEQAEDLIQGFFVELLEKDVLKKCQRGRGRFRSFLIKALEYHRSNELAKSQAGKRGGGATVLSLDVTPVESRYQLHVGQGLTPEKLYERAWARTVISRARDQLEQTYAQRDQSRLFETLKRFLAGDGELPRYSEIARELETTEGAAQVALHRMRRRLADAIRQEVSQTVARPEDVEDEIRGLFSAFE
jgi:RNA polymerase sigma factor (sigma-70 family)